VFSGTLSMSLNLVRDRRICQRAFMARESRPNGRRVFG
jgi:hypothetical protein